MKGSEKPGLILASREDFNTFQPTHHFVHLSMPRALCSLSCSCSFHCHLPPGCLSSESSNLFQCCSTLLFPTALIVFLHLSIWLISQRNKNHSRDISDVWSHVSFFLFLPPHMEFGAPIGTISAAISHHGIPALAIPQALSY